MSQIRARARLSVGSDNDEGCSSLWAFRVSQIRARARCTWDAHTTKAAACRGHLECLKYAHEHGCPWHSATTRVAAYNKKLVCLKYIYEHCGDIVTWEDSNLKNNVEEFSEECSVTYGHVGNQNYIKSVKEEWKAGLNRPGTRTKPAIR